MRKIHSTLRLFFEAGLSIRAIVRTLRVSPAVPAKGGMGDAIRRAEVAGLSWPSPEGLDERALEARLFPGAGVPAPARRAMPQWVHVHAELRRKGVALSLLCQEDKGEHPEGLRYSQFCERYRALRQGVDGVMRHTHRAGEKLCVGYAGHTAPIVDRESGARRRCSSRCSGRRATSPRTRGPPGRRQRRVAGWRSMPSNRLRFALTTSSVLASRSNCSSDGYCSPNIANPDIRYSARHSPRLDTGSSISSKQARTSRNRPGALNPFFNSRLAMTIHPSLTNSIYHSDIAIKIY